MEKKISEYDILLDPDYINELELHDVFIFYLEPHDAQYPCQPIHIYLNQTGNANYLIRELTLTIIRQIEKTP